MAKKCCNNSSAVEANACSSPQNTCFDTPNTLSCAQQQQSPTTSYMQQCAPAMVGGTLAVGIPPMPYYNQVNICPEDNRKTIYVQKISQTFRTKSAFCMPACGARVRVVFDGITDVAVGAWMWAYGLGFLKVSGFNAYTQEIELENICPANCQDQAAPGTPIPACTVFVLTAPTCPSASGNPDSTFPFLNSGFVAPANGDCIDISVTSVNGLSVNRNVSINTGTYQVSAIKSGTLVTICNIGAGLTPGTVVDYKDGAGNLIVPIVLIDSNPCLNDSILAGKPLACHGGVTSPLEGNESGQVLVYDAGTGESNYRTLGIPVLNCTDLTACLILDPDNDSSHAYLVEVASTVLYTEGDLVTIGGTQFTVTSIDSSTLMHITPVTPPTAVQTYGVGATLCSATCCQQLQAQIDCFFTSSNQADATAIAPTSVSDTEPIATPGLLRGNVASLTIVNESDCFQMGVHFVIDWIWSINLFGDDGNTQDIGYFSEYVVDADPLAPTALVYDLPESYYYFTVSGLIFNRKSKAATFSGFFLIPPGETRTIKGVATMSWNEGNADEMAVQALATRISYLGEAII